MTPPSVTREEADRIVAEHRLCGKPFDGCYSHFEWMDHCRADGMAWPCDVHQLRAAPDRLAALDVETLARAILTTLPSAYVVTVETAEKVAAEYARTLTDRPRVPPRNASLHRHGYGPAHIDSEDPRDNDGHEWSDDDQRKAEREREKGEGKNR